MKRIAFYVWKTRTGLSFCWLHHVANGRPFCMTFNTEGDDVPAWEIGQLLGGN